MPNRSIMIPMALLIAAGPLAIGCGGGASTETTVIVKRDSADSGNSGGSNGDGGQGDGAAAPEGFGTFRGRVVFVGAAPDLPLLIRAGANIRDAEVCAAGNLPNEQILVSPDGGVANVYIYLRNAPRGVDIPPPPAEPAVFDQKNCRFFPHAFLVRTDQQVLVKNSDPILHNTHTYPARNDQFNNGIAMNMDMPTVYTKPEPQPLEVKCDIHAWMKAYHLPLDHPYAAVTDENGAFEIKDLPAGDHKFLVWHEGAVGRFLSRNLPVTINPDQVVEKTIEYPLDKFDQ